MIVYTIPTVKYEDRPWCSLCERDKVMKDALGDLRDLCYYCNEEDKKARARIRKVLQVEYENIDDPRERVLFAKYHNQYCKGIGSNNKLSTYFTQNELDEIFPRLKIKMGKGDKLTIVS